MKYYLLDKPLFQKSFSQKDGSLRGYEILALYSLFQLLYMQKNRSLGPGILEALLTKVKSPFHRQYRMKGHVTGSLQHIPD